MKLNLKHFITSIVSAVLLTALFGSFAALAADGTLTLTADADITEDSGISVITPSLTVNGEQITDFEGIRYSLDSICAKPAANDDGTLSLSGRINGEVSVGAAFTYDGVTYTAEPVSVTVSGQYDRISAKKVKVVAFGNSITTHPTLDDWTSSGQGMAADSLSQDYVHVFTSQLEDKYGEGNVSLAIKGAVSFERAMDTASTTTDWSSFLADDAKYVEEQQPDIIVLQMGENCFTSSVPADYVNVYRHAMESFVNIMRQKAPDATILLVSSTWGATVNGVISAAKNVDVPYVRSDIIYQMEGSKASEDNYGGTNGGIGAHPGNLGHERMGLAAYESINLYLTTMLDEALPYSATPAELKISGDSEITVDGGSIKLTAAVLPAEAVQDVSFSISDSRVAKISKDGVVTAITNGTVTVTAVSAFDESVKSTFTVGVSGQSDPYTLTYYKNTADSVTGIPEANSYAKGETALEAVYPERTHYTFLGWSLTPDGDIVTSVNVTKDTTVYAIWEKAYRWAFDRPDYIGVREGLNFVDGFTTNAYHAEIEDEQFTFMTTDPDNTGTVFTVNSPALDLTASDYSALFIKQKNIAVKNSVLKVVISTDNGEYSFEKSVPDTSYNDYVFDLSGISGNITGFTLYPTNLDTTVYIDSIAFVPKSQGAVFTFDKTAPIIAECTDFSIDKVDANAKDGKSYLIKTGSKVLVHNDDYSVSMLYTATENGLVKSDYYLVCNDMGYGSFALDSSLVEKSNILIAFYMPDGRIRKVITSFDISDGRVYFTTPNVFECTHAKAFVLDTGIKIKPLTKEALLSLYDVITTYETDEDGDTFIDVDWITGNDGEDTFIDTDWIFN